MIALIQEQFEHNTANLITRFLEHPTAPMIRRYQEYTDLLAFDARNDWHRWQSLYGFQTINGSRRAYVTYGGGAGGRDSEATQFHDFGGVLVRVAQGLGAPRDCSQNPPGANAGD